MWQCWHAVRLSLFSPLVRIHLKKITKTIAKQTSIRKYIIKYIFCFSCWIFCLLKKCQPAVAGEEFRHLHKHLKVFQWFPQECLCPSAANVEDLTTLNGDRWQSHCLFVFSPRCISNYKLLQEYDISLRASDGIGN